MRSSIHVSAILWLALFLGGLGYFISHLLTFIEIFSAHAGITLSQAEALKAYEKGANAGRIQYIPKITHQIFHNWRQPGNDTLPADWQQVRKTCLDKNPGWEHKLWTEKASREFIEKEHPWFLQTYDGYSIPVQRVDALRYFLLMHYGGIYIDLDNGCLANLEPLLYYPTWITDGDRGALSNNILASAPHHPFWVFLTQSLRPYNYRYFFPYATISYASGQWFETAVWQAYHRMLPRSGGKTDDGTAPRDYRLHRLIMDNRPEADEWLFFSQERGGSWNSWDNYFFGLIGDHLILFALFLIATFAGPIWLILRLVRRRGGGLAGYRRLVKHSD